ncbi:MAG: hypothetical protein IJ699_06460 [Bacteroidaceae bacterium]|nr:hypothetical protein [Bacteroidaceae bacterium]
MAYSTNNDKLLQAVLLDEKLMSVGNYTPAEIGNIYQALDSDNCVINAVAQIINRAHEGASAQELWKEINSFLYNNV